MRERRTGKAFPAEHAGDLGHAGLAAEKAHGAAGLVTDGAGYKAKAPFKTGRMCSDTDAGKTSEKRKPTAWNRGSLVSDLVDVS